MLRPVVATLFSAIEHYEGQLSALGDALGTDCVVVRITDADGRTWARSYTNDGARNEDWYGWLQPVLAPVDGVVVKIRSNDVVNEPGKMGQGNASYIVLRTDEGVHVLLAHVQSVRVKEGDRVRGGDEIAKVGNNGQSRHPHVHVGAWRERRPLQIRWDQHVMKSLQR